MGKIATFIESDGWANTLRFIWKGIRGYFAHTSHTYCLFADRLSISGGGYSVDYEIISNVKGLENVNFPRLKSCPWRKWLNKGSRVALIYENGEPVAFGWTHFKSHSVDAVGKFDLGEEKAWLGPQFVHHKHRGHGLQKELITLSVSNAPESIKSFITSVNVRNTASLHSYKKCGFQKGLEVSYTAGMFAKKKTEIRVLSSLANNYFKLTQ